MSGSLHLEDGRRVPVVDGLVIGRSADCGIALHDEKSSRQHARLVVQVGVVEVEDLGSRNGTLLNGTRVQRRMLRDGDVITIGKSKLTYRDADGPAVSATRSAAGGLAPGDDLFGDASPAAVDPQPVAKPEIAAPPPARMAPPVKPATAGPVDVLEFVDDDVVEVRKPSPSASSAASTAGGPARSSTPAAGQNRVAGVLQFHARPDKRGVLAGDIAQLGGPVKFAIVLLGIAVALGLGWLVMNFVSG